MQEHAPILEQEPLKMLMETSTTSAPGFSGIGYQLLKQACLGWDKVWDGLLCTLISVYNTCLVMIDLLLLVVGHWDSQG